MRTGLRQGRDFLLQSTPYEDGRMRIMVSNEEIILEPGDRLDLAANVVHSADVFGDEAVVTLCASR